MSVTSLCKVLKHPFNRVSRLVQRCHGCHWLLAVLLEVCQSLPQPVPPSSPASSTGSWAPSSALTWDCQSKRTAVRSSVCTPKCISTSSTCMTADRFLLWCWLTLTHVYSVDFLCYVDFSKHLAFTGDYGGGRCNGCWRQLLRALFWVFRSLEGSPGLGHHEEVVVLA